MTKARMNKIFISINFCKIASKPHSKREGSFDEKYGIENYFGAVFTQFVH